MVEIERKFLIDADKWNAVKPKTGIAIRQGYIFNEEKGVLRVRIKGEKGFLTIKSKNVSATRLEIEHEIPLNEATVLLEKMCDRFLSKTRYLFNFEGHLWEIDEFENRLAPLILAEIELKSEDEGFVRPDFITQEVTENPAYYNSELIKNA